MVIRRTDTIIAYTDGSYKKSENQYVKSGGWACVFINGTQLECAYDYGDRGDSHETEIEAILIAVMHVPKSGKLIVRSDSADLVSEINRQLECFTVNGPRKSSHIDPRKRKIEKIVHLAYRKNFVSFEYVQGHHEDQYNIIADALAAKSRMKSMSRYPKFHVNNNRGIGHSSLTQ